ncbi:MAG: hypothetical protein K2R98_25665 [Gemmataceae bacterium]|nr:hypothetical protein [Gemmataceae bacterium]
MQSEPASGKVESVAALPPVVPPSGRHIVQLFIVPGAIVLGIVVLFLGCFGFWGLFFGTTRPPQEYLADLESSNPDVRWRAANDLAQVIKRDDNLAADPKLGLKLADLLNQALDERDREPRTDQKPTAGNVVQEDKDRKAQRKYIQFLSSCLGNMSVPIGAPVLTRMALKDQGTNDPVATVLRRHAVWVLANHGENRKRFDKVSEDKRQAVRDQLEEVANEGKGQHAQWARLALDGMKGTGELGVIRALDEVQKSEYQKNDGDPFLRRMVAFALTFWEGTPAENTVAEKALYRLSLDDGHGVMVDVSPVD